MPDPKDTITPGDASEDAVKAADPKEAAPKGAVEQKAELQDSDLEQVAGGFGPAPLPLAQKNIGQSLTQGGRSVVSSIAGVQFDKQIKP
jgi:hypothetical protein